MRKYFWVKTHLQCGGESCFKVSSQIRFKLYETIVCTGDIAPSDESSGTQTFYPLLCLGLYFHSQASALQTALRINYSALQWGEYILRTKSASERQNVPLFKTIANDSVYHAKGFYLRWRLVKACNSQTAETYMPASKLELTTVGDQWGNRFVCWTRCGFRQHGRWKGILVLGHATLPSF